MHFLPLCVCTSTFGSQGIRVSLLHISKKNLIIHCPVQIEQQRNMTVCPLEFHKFLLKILVSFSVHYCGQQWVSLTAMVDKIVLHTQILRELVL